MLTATKKKAKRPERTEPLHCWLDVELLAQLRVYTKQADPRLSKTATVESALKAYLAERGFWPPRAAG